MPWIQEKNSYYEITLPAAYPLKFYINVDDDRVYVETRQSYRLEIDQDILISIEDTTAVYNPLLE